MFLAIFLQRERYDTAKGSVRTWILQFAYFKSLLRRRYRRIRGFYREQETVEEQELRSADGERLLGLNRIEWARFVEKGLAALGAKQRRTIELIHVHGCTLLRSPGPQFSCARRR